MALDNLFLLQNCKCASSRKVGFTESQNLEESEKKKKIKNPSALTYIISEKCFGKWLNVKTQITIEEMALPRSHGISPLKCWYSQ